MGLRKPGGFTSTARCDAKKSIAVCNANGLYCVVLCGREDLKRASDFYIR